MKRTYIKYDEFEVKVGKGVVTSHGEVQIVYTVESSSHYLPSEGPDVQVLSVKYRMHPTHPWQEDPSDFFSDIYEEYLLQHAMEEDDE